MTPTPSRDKRLTGRHVLLITLGFFFVVFAVDGVFIWRALATFPGEVSATAYEDGLAYNRALDARARAAALGWRVDAAAGAVPGQVLARVTDANGSPVPGVVVTGSLTRPATADGRRTFAFQALRPGVFEASADVARGAWDLKLEARDRGGHVFDAERRLVWR